MVTKRNKKIKDEQQQLPMATRPSGRDKHAVSLDVLKQLRVRRRYDAKNDVTLFRGDCASLLKTLRDAGEKAKLVVTSPPYNIGKDYERHSKKSTKQYVADQTKIIELCSQILDERGSLCWQVGNHVVDGYIQPLDILLYDAFVNAGFVLRNRIIWHFEHGLNTDRRLSGRYETIMWFTRKVDDYAFDVDPIRVPQKYPAKKAHRGPRKGEYLSNPLGKNPGDVWIFPNVKHNHPEKIGTHPCQFPFELVERLVLALTEPGDLVVDPFMGSGTTAVGAAFFGRRFAGADLVEDYVLDAEDRMRRLMSGTLRVRRMNTPVYEPRGKLTIPPWEQEPPSLLEAPDVSI
jgi:adenine-specific DNA-methyltransferase